MMKRHQSAKTINSDSSSESDDEVEWKSRPKRVKRVQSSSDGSSSSDSEQEEGELSSDVEEEDDGLDEDLMGDEADRKRLAQMTEKEREEELFKRAEMREAMRARRSVKEKLREEKRRRQQQMQRQNQKSEVQDNDKDKRKSRREDENAASRANAGTSRQKALEEKRNGANKFAQLIERRKAKLKTSEIFSDEDESSSSYSSDSDSDIDISLGTKGSEKKLSASGDKSKTLDNRSSKVRRNRDSDDSSSSASSDPRKRRQRKRSVSSSGSSRARSNSRSSSPSGSEDGECKRSDSSGDEGGNYSKGSRASSRKNAAIETLDELLRIKLSRFKMEKWVHMPFFKELVKGCYVRVGIGNREGIAIYRIAEIEDVVETGKIYDLGPTRTNRGLILRHGDDRQMFRLCFLSNQDFSQSEWEKWLASMDVAKLPLPTRAFVHCKEEEIIHALNHRIENDAELERILDEKKRFRRGPTNYTVQKIELLKLRQVAESQGDTSKVAKLTLEMTDLESEANEKERRRTSAIKSITYINERNRAQNLKLAEEASKREFEELEEMQRNGQQDPFSRLQTRPVLFGRKKTTNQNQPSKPAAKTNSAKEQNDKPDQVGPQKDASGNRSESGDREGSVGDVFSIHNFDINIDLDVPLSAPLPPSVPVNSSGPGAISIASADLASSGSNLVGSRRGLNLEEYKKRRGLI